MSKGMLYIGSPGSNDFAPLRETVGSELVISERTMYTLDSQELFTSDEATFTVKMTKEQLENFFEFVFHVKDQVLRIISNEGNARVCHLAKHGRKARTRKKNVRRAFRTLEKEG